MKFLHFLYFLPTEGKFAKLHLTIVLHKEECKQCSDNGHELSSGSPFFEGGYGCFFLGRNYL